MSPALTVRLYDLFVVALSLLAVVGLGAGLLLPLGAASREVLDLLDVVLCVLFFVDFLKQLRDSQDPFRYFVTWGWLDLIASVPVVDSLRMGRFGRIVRVLRLVRVFKAGHLLVRLLATRRREAAVYGGGFLYVLTLFSGAILILEAESAHPHANIRTAEDALWWTMTTISTVGYGDRYPVTTLGRVVAACLMLFGVGAFGAVSGVAMSLFVRAAPSERSSAPVRERERGETTGTERTTP